MISVKLFSLFYRAYKSEIIWLLSLFAFFKCNGGGLIRRVEEGKGVYHRDVHFSREAQFNHLDCLSSFYLLYYEGTQTVHYQYNYH